ncbi:Para-aminobenzoate synthase, aminase component [Acidisarcina polymorpha]|uniref:Para-aminobenzoate synthase, aminase component n=1 Tax=Acidisarcina polymorpha TaxID=2211140 RepID=A0A2Z5FWP1_9BACT|nr:aminotransferase class IV [Acidisarcina polymorpha]AXC11172.1 Para-aminobenzoate synthase, aminase component [Acidisarcina polymorpha]
MGNKIIESPEFELFETMYGTSTDGLRHLDRHLGRLTRSARDLGFECDIIRLHDEVRQFEASLTHGVPHRVRLSLKRSGEIHLQSVPIEPLRDEPVKIFRAPDLGFLPRNSLDPLLQYKTSLRGDYDRGWQLAQGLGGFDMLFSNERGELTEGGRTNVFLRIDGSIWTPPLSSGLLPGIMRGVLLDDPKFGAAERVLPFSELARAEEIMICNSLRGVLHAVLV